MFNYSNLCFYEVITSISSQTVQIASHAIPQIIEQNGALQKVSLGASALIFGSAAFIKSGMIARAESYFTGREVEHVKIGVAAISAFEIATGAYLIFDGFSELYLQYSNNLCEAKPGFCHDNLGIPRANMPQIEGAGATNFFHYLEENQITVLHKYVEATQLSSTQNELNKAKVEKMVLDARAGQFNPCEMEIIASTDGHVIDGHHRWATCLSEGRNIYTALVDLPSEVILKIANNIPGVTHQGLNQFSK